MLHNISSYNIMIGWGVFAKEIIEKDSFVVEYKGKRIPGNEYKEEEKSCYIYCFEHYGKQ